ncbi:MAG: BON domain-containing protein [Pirellulales bacterium]|nr:BON domain-containing protein [Pirellulales bacterium]
MGLAGRVGASVGELTGMERFVRTNRTRNDFVGSDLADRVGFIGSIQGNTRGAIRSAITNLRPLVNEQINRIPPEPLTRQARPYAPRYQIGFDYPLPPSEEVEASLARQLLRVPGMERLGPVEVSVVGQTAILRGAVASEHQRDVAEQLVLLEPGIREVQNELTVGPPVESPSVRELPEAPAASSLGTPVVPGLVP